MGLADGPFILALARFIRLDIVRLWARYQANTAMARGLLPIGERPKPGV